MLEKLEHKSIEEDAMITTFYHSPLYQWSQEKRKGRRGLQFFND
jgi:hypothetical protein